MNAKDNDGISKLTVEVKNISTQVKKILTNDLPHLNRRTRFTDIKVNFILAFLGIVMVLSGLSIAVSLGVIK